MKEKFRVIVHQIETMRDEIRSKDAALIREHCSHVKVSKEMDRQREQLEKMRKRRRELGRRG